MAIWKIAEDKPKRVQETGLKKEKLLEENLESWIEKMPEILGESLMIIGRQVMIPEFKDRLDLLAIDTQGAAVIIELKRGKLKDPVDVQSLRYASYISKWKFDDFESVAKNYFTNLNDQEFNFNSEFESFCENSGIDDIPDINEEQRIVVVGSSVKDKLGSVALWLRDHSIDIKLIKIQVYKNGGELLIEPNVIVPLQVSKFSETGKLKSDSNPWLGDGKNWHLEKRCSQKTKEWVVKLDELLIEMFDLENPSWKQKHYIAYRINNYNWLSLKTESKTIALDFLIKKDTFNQKDLANKLRLVEFDVNSSLGEKLNLPSSVCIKNRNDKGDRIIIRIKDDFNFKSESFINFLKKAYNNCF